MQGKSYFRICDLLQIYVNVCLKYIHSQNSNFSLCKSSSLMKSQLRAIDCFIRVFDMSIEQHKSGRVCLLDFHYL